MFALRRYVNVHKKRMHPVLKKDEESIEPNVETISPKSEPTPPPPKRMKPSNELNNDWKNLAEANHMSKLPLWGVKGKETFNIGA